MYKCKECGCEYETKPDFCDCGNDSFDLIEEKKEFANEKKNVKPEHVSINNDIATNDKIYKPIDLFSIIFFIICVILSIIVIFFVWNPKEQVQLVQETEKAIKQIPNIESFWNNSVAEKKDQTPEVKPEQKMAIQPIQEKIVKQVEKLPVKKTVATQKVSKPANVISKSSKNASKQKISTNKSQVSQKVINNNVQTPAKTNVEQAKPAAKPVTAPIEPQKVEEKIVVSEPKVDNTLVKKELNNYKAGLRNTIGRKIDFTKVIGDGECTISFKVSANGTLINKAFSKYSSNITLNDAVYKAVMATPAYNPPPSGYKNETIYIKVSFYDSNYIVDVI